MFRVVPKVDLKKSFLRFRNQACVWLSTAYHHEWIPYGSKSQGTGLVRSQPWYASNRPIRAADLTILWANVADAGQSSNGNITCQPCTILRPIIHHAPGLLANWPVKAFLHRAPSPRSTLPTGEIHDFAPLLSTRESAGCLRRDGPSDAEYGGSQHCRTYSPDKGEGVGFLTGRTPEINEPAAT